MDSISNKKWYIVNVYSGHEKKVEESLLQMIETHNLHDKIFRIVVAEQEVPVMKDGKPTGKMRKKNIYPGYVYIEMIMSNDAWFAVRNTQGVTGIAGSGGGGRKPTPVSLEEMEPVLKRIGQIDDSMYDRYKVGDLVKIIQGAFADSEGKIIDIDKDSGVCKIEIVFFGRRQVIDVDFVDIDRI